MNIKPKSKGRGEVLTIRMTKGEMKTLENILKQAKRPVTGVGWDEHTIEVLMRSCPSSEFTK